MRGKGVTTHCRISATVNRVDTGCIGMPIENMCVRDVVEGIRSKSIHYAIQVEIVPEYAKIRTRSISCHNIDVVDNPPVELIAVISMSPEADLEGDVRIS